MLRKTTEPLWCVPRGLSAVSAPQVPSDEPPSDESRSPASDEPPRDESSSPPSDGSRSLPSDESFSPLGGALPRVLSSRAGDAADTDARRSARDACCVPLREGSGRVYLPVARAPRSESGRQRFSATVSQHGGGTCREPSRRISALPALTSRAMPHPQCNPDHQPSISGHEAID